VILEVDLNDLVWESEHDSMSCSHPFFSRRLHLGFFELVSKHLQAPFD
jgi:hypothetical protein